MQPRILMVGTYRIKPAIHGGQRRIAFLMKGFQRLGLEVVYLCITQERSWTDSDMLSWIVGEPTVSEIAKQPKCDDLFLGATLTFEPERITKFVQLIDEFSPDVIQIEQPSAWASLRMVIGLLNKKPKIIYSSQNIENVLKSTIYPHFLSQEETNLRCSQVLAIERDLTRKADSVIAVSQDDIQTFRTWGAKNCYLIPNGTECLSVNPLLLELMQKTAFPCEEIKKFALFIGSEHMPNNTGFWNMIGPDLGYLSEETKIVIVGGVCQLIHNHLKRSEMSEINQNRLMMFRTLSDDLLAVLLSLCDVILLPIIDGGGSNLKTAQAIVSNRPILATKFAMRSFEAYSSVNGLTIVETAADFKEELKKHLDPSVPRIQDVQRDHVIIKELEWSSYVPPALQKVLASL